MTLSGVTRESGGTRDSGGARGRFITFEGGEGAGKSTQVRRLVESLRAKGIDCLQTREPGGAVGAEEIRALLVNGEPGRWDGMTELLLHFAARRDHLVKTIWPALAAGTWVVCDRFADSTFAYQGVGHDIGEDVVQKVYEIALGDFRPDLTLILDLPVEDGLKRAGYRNGLVGGGEDRYERMGREFHGKLRAAFLAIAAREPERVAVVSALGSMDEIEQAVAATVAERLGADGL